MNRVSDYVSIVLILVCLDVVAFSFKQTIMKDKWMNLGYEEDELKPYIEPSLDFKEQKRIGTFYFYPRIVAIDRV